MTLSPYCEANDLLKRFLACCVADSSVTIVITAVTLTFLSQMSVVLSFAVCNFKVYFNSILQAALMWPRFHPPFER
jgi:hypothetical protein